MVARKSVGDGEFQLFLRSVWQNNDSRELSHKRKMAGHDVVLCHMLIAAAQSKLV